MKLGFEAMATFSHGSGTHSARNGSTATICVYDLDFFNPSERARCINGLGHQRSRDLCRAVDVSGAEMVGEGRLLGRVSSVL